jgi:SAM-dependent methyltransferase
LLDLDPRALEFAQVKIYEKLYKHNKKIKIHFVNVSVKEFLTSKSIINAKFDLIYSGGLFDYLDNFTSSAVVTSLYRFLNPKGSMIIGNFTHDNPSKGFCHLVIKWHLIHKHENEMVDWFKNIPIKKSSSPTRMIIKSSVLDWLICLMNFLP